jgi:DinB superfamily
MTPEQIMVDVAIANWKLTIKRATSLFDGLTDKQFFQHIAPGRNRVIYLLGHLTAVHDAMLPLLGLGERQHAELDNAFITTPDGGIESLPSVADLKRYWNEINSLLLEKFVALTPEQWLERHTAMTDEDLVKDPTRNRLSVFLNRTNHTAFHLGQLVLAREKK